MMQQPMYDDESSFTQHSQPERAPYETNQPFKPKHRGIYRPPLFFLNFTSLIFALLGMIFFFIAFGGTSWYIVPVENTIVPKSFGLWRLCVRSECVVDMTNDYMVKRYLIGNEAEDNNDEVIGAFEHYLMPVKVLMCVAVISVLIMMAANLAFLAGLPTFFLEGIAQIFSGVMVAIALGIFGGNFRDPKNVAPFGWSYWCGVVAAMILIVNGAVMMMISVMVFRKRGGFVRRK